MSKVYQPLIDPARLDFWLDNEMNVLFSGKHGVGKTASMMQAFERKGWKCLYLSGATCDPYMDFLGVPRAVEGDEGTKLELLSVNDLNDYDAVFIDEFNRAPKAVRNGCMELIQFKAIHGKKFNNLKVVWAAVNPEDEGEYDVEEIDPAQKDRFQVFVTIPYECCPVYFSTKYTDKIADRAISYWRNLPVNTRDRISPRRLDYALDWAQKGGNVADVLPETANIQEFINIINRNSLSEILADADKRAILELASDPNHVPNVLPTILSDMRNEQSIDNPLEKMYWFTQEVSEDIVDSFIDSHLLLNDDGKYQKWSDARTHGCGITEEVQDYITYVISQDGPSRLHTAKDVFDKWLPEPSLHYSAWGGDEIKNKIANHVKKTVSRKDAGEYNVYFQFNKDAIINIPDPVNKKTPREVCDMIDQLVKVVKDVMDNGGLPRRLQPLFRTQLWDGNIPKKYGAPNYGSIPRLAWYTSANSNQAIDEKAVMDLEWLVGQCYGPNDTKNFFDKFDYALGVINSVIMGRDRYNPNFDYNDLDQNIKTVMRNKARTQHKGVFAYVVK
jgi:hypothetical protein